MCFLLRKFFSTCNRMSVVILISLPLMLFFRSIKRTSCAGVSIGQVTTTRVTKVNKLLKFFPIVLPLLLNKIRRENRIILMKRSNLSIPNNIKAKIVRFLCLMTIIKIAILVIYREALTLMIKPQVNTHTQEIQ